MVGERVEGGTYAADVAGCGVWGDELVAWVFITDDFEALWLRRWEEQA